VSFETERAPPRHAECRSSVTEFCLRQDLVSRVGADSCPRYNRCRVRRASRRLLLVAQREIDAVGLRRRAAWCSDRGALWYVRRSTALFVTPCGAGEPEAFRGVTNTELAATPSPTLPQGEGAGESVPS
jgi:hypothetical protein